MDSSRAKTFQQMADELGIRHKLMYTLPEGRKVGRMVRPEWVEQWIEEGTHGIEAA